MLILFILDFALVKQVHWMSSFFFKHKRNSITPPHSRKTGSWVLKKGKKETKKRKEWLRVLLSFWMYEHSIGKNNNIGMICRKKIKTRIQKRKDQVVTGTSWSAN